MTYHGNRHEKSRSKTPSILVVYSILYNTSVGLFSVAMHNKSELFRLNSKADIEIYFKMYWQKPIRNNKSLQSTNHSELSSVLIVLISLVAKYPRNYTKIKLTYTNIIKKICRETIEKKKKTVQIEWRGAEILYRLTYAMKIPERFYSPKKCPSRKKNPS